MPSLIHELRRFIRPIFLVVGAVSFFINLLILPISLYSLQVMDRVLSTGSMPTLLWLTTIMLVLFVAAGLLQTLRGMVLARAADWVHDVLVKKMLPMVLVQAGEKGTQSLRDAGTLKQFIGGPGLSTLMDAPWSVLYIAALFVIHSLLGILVTAGAALLLLLAWLNEVSIRVPVREAGVQQMRAMQELELATRNAEVTAAMGMGAMLAGRWQRWQEAITRLQSVANDRSSVIQGITRFFRLSLQVLVTCVSAWLAIRGHVTIGAVIAASILASRALAPFEAAISSWKSLLDTRSAYDRLVIILSADKAAAEIMSLPAPIGALQVEDLSYQVDGREQPILENISFSLESGEVLGVIGPNGAGKSTLLRLLIGILPPTHGVVRLDGADIGRWPRDDLGKYVGYLPQDVELFAGSVRDNIARFRPDITSESVIQAAQLASAHELILRLPQGYDTDIGAGGKLLSAGQRQRIGLARAIFGEPRLLIMDEPDANLDDAGLQALMLALNSAKQRCVTTVMVTHRKSLLSNADKLLLLSNGAIEAFGPTAKVLTHIAVRQPQARQPEASA